MAIMAELRSANEGIEDQMREWKQQRYASGENPMDWLAFRRHLLDAGAPDPGEVAPDEFYRWGEEMAGGQPVENSPATGQPAAAPHAFGKSISEVNSLQGEIAGTGGDTATWPGEVGAGSTTSAWPEKKDA